MIFKVSRTSDRLIDPYKKIEINTLEELIQFCKDNDDLILSVDRGDGLLYLEIYDDYRE